MNSLNILSARVSPPQTPSLSRNNSYGNLLSSAEESEPGRNSQEDILNEKVDDLESVEDIDDDRAADEETPLLGKESIHNSGPEPLRWHSVPKRISNALVESIRWVLSTFAAPGVYLIACLYDERGNFAPLKQLRKLGSGFPGSGRRTTTDQGSGVAAIEKERSAGEQNNGRSTHGRRGVTRGSRAASSNSSSSGLSSESESDRDRAVSGETPSSSSRHTRSKSLQNSDEIAPARRSIRIKLHNDDNLRQRKHRRAQSANNSSGSVAAGEISPATLKSPTSPASSILMTKYPRAPVPPRPLIPRRQPSYTISDSPNGRVTRKTLILDLDETLIHSMAKGGRMSTGHMVEVKLNGYVAADGSSVGPPHPILYYVHKRPHCDDFLRRVRNSTFRGTSINIFQVCKWYNLVIFTASVQEYADPVIDLLEQERKFFSGRYYRQHCTLRQSAYIKDLSSVEPDLSKVMILDNSPLSYMFHQGKITVRML